jgi:glycine/D-amino acid oxidase-like deaminating enzyme
MISCFLCFPVFKFCFFKYNLYRYSAEGAFMACGHNCWGILWAPVTGQIVSEVGAVQAEFS